MSRNNLISINSLNKSFGTKQVLKDISFNVVKSESFVIIGGSGSGKTTMMLTLANSIASSGNVALFNTAEESLHQVKMTADRLELRSGFLVGGENHVPTILKGCDKVREMFPDKHFFLILDSLQTLDDTL